MKKALLLCLTLITATFCFAQQQLATLNHNDSITVYYGASALQQAHAAAVNGDIITLSPGAFTSVDITKAVTIRGAGMFPDTISGIGSTILTNNFTITINNDSLHHLTMEGIYCSGQSMHYSTIYNPQFVKCYFRGINYSTNNTMVNASFINCIIENFTNSSRNNTAYARNTMFINSVILGQQTGSTGDWSINGCSSTLINCVAKLHFYHPQYLSIINSIVYYQNVSYSASGHTCFNSIGINAWTNYSNNYFNTTGLVNHYLYNYGSFASVFKNFRGTYGEGITFELQDSIAATCLGNDSTQVGIYGGTMPFDPRVSGLNIRRCDVARRTTADGKLAVDIEVVNDETTNTTEE